MGCESCGDKKPMQHKKGCHNTPPVIQINNPSEVVLFRKVIIPASMGDEEKTPVTIGKYCNVLAVYEANGHAYMYSSDGVPTKIGFDAGSILFVSKLPKVEEASVGFLYITEQGIAAITNDGKKWVRLAGGGTGDFNALINRPKFDGVEMTGDTDIPDLSGDISELGDLIGETKDLLSNEIETLSSSLLDEAANRQEADSELNEKIELEIINRENAVNAVSDELDAEKIARAEGDTAANERINTVVNNLTTEINTRISADEALQADIEEEAETRAAADDDLQEQITAEATARQNADTAMQGEIDTIDNAIDKTVMVDLSLNNSPSTTTVQLDADKQNIKTGSTSTKNIPLPVASATQAGIINSATYAGIMEDHEKIEAILGSGVAVNDLPANPTQAQITASWKNAAGTTANPTNGAKVFDMVNTKAYQYYENVDTWILVQDGVAGSITVDTFTNTAEGLIKGSSVDGQVHAEVDGTGSVQGWDTVKADIATNASNIAGKVDKVNGKGLSTNDYTNADKAIVDGVTTALAGKQDNLSAGTGIDSTELSNDTIEIDDTVVVYEQPGTTPQNMAFVGTDNIQDGAVTADKIDFATSGPDANGWMMTKLSDSLAIWTYKKNKTGVNFNANTWSWISSETIPGPVDLVNALGGSANRQAGNPAVSLQAAINDAGNVTMYYSNRSTNAITTNVYTNAIVFGTYKQN